MRQMHGGVSCFGLTHADPPPGDGACSLVRLLLALLGWLCPPCAEAVA
jgi:hypothetical protein